MLPSCFLDDHLCKAASEVLVHHAGSGHQKIGLAVRPLIRRRHKHIVKVCLGRGPTTTATHLQGQQKPWSMTMPTPTTPEAEKTGEHPLNEAWANGQTGCGHRAAMCPEHLACTPLLTAGASGAASSVACQRQLRRLPLLQRRWPAWQQKRGRGSGEGFS
jgi:hypothetical protein